MPIFDTHAHYDSSRFHPDRSAVLSALPEAGVGLVLNPGCDLPSSQAAAELSERYPFLYAAAGVHPQDCGQFSDGDLLALEGLLQREKTVAVGEIGLDYHYPDNPPRSLQQTVFRRQLALAEALDLPVIVHDREAHEDCLSIISEFPGVTGVFHCFSGSAEMARILVERGWYLGFDGPVTYPGAKRASEVVAAISPERILVETDAPYLTPAPFRGERNDSRYLPYILEQLARWTGLTAAELERLTWENGKRLFRIP